jgi:hypothetical protein
MSRVSPGQAARDSWVFAEASHGGDAVGDECGEVAQDARR